MTGRHGDSGPSSSTERRPCSRIADTSPQPNVALSAHRLDSSEAKPSGVGPRSSPSSARACATATRIPASLPRSAATHARTTSSCASKSATGMCWSQSSTDAMRPAFA